MVQVRLKSAHWILLAVIALTPTAGVAQQDSALQGESQQDRAQQEAAQATTEVAQGKTEEDGTLTLVPGGQALGMSILGNQEAPTSLVIVPWKGSEIGESVGISTMLDDSRQPVDKEVFMRALLYYEIRSETKP